MSDVPFQFDRYPADPDQMRQQAFLAVQGADSVQELMSSLSDAHAATLGAVEGQLEPAVTEGFVGPKIPSEMVIWCAAWAAAQVEAFADAVEVYNDSGTSPRSIALLNQELATQWANRCGVPSGSGPAATHYDDELQAKWQALKAQLTQEKAQLDANLDAAAAQTQAALLKSPTTYDMQQAVEDGHLPAWVAEKFEGTLFNLTPSGPPPGVTQEVYDLQDDSDVIDRLTSGKPLSETELDYLNIEHPEAMQSWADNWEPGADVYVTPDEGGGNYGSIVGPDGKTYPVQLPQCTGAEVAPGGLGNEKGVWTTTFQYDKDLHVDADPVSVQDKGAIIIGSIAGADYQLPPDGQAVVGNPEDYLSFDEDGSVTVANQPDAPPQYAPQPPEPAPDDPTQPEIDPTHPKAKTGTVASGVVDLAVGALQGVVITEQMDMNQSYAGNIVLQTDADGNTRAVIQLAQVQNQGGQVAVDTEYGSVTDDSTITTID